MVANLFGPILKQVLGGVGGASHQPSTIQKTEEKQPTTPPLEQVQVNAAVITPQEQLRATANSMSRDITPETVPTQAISLPTKLQETSPGFQVTISQETMNNLQPIFSKALKTLMEIVPFIAEGIKTILPTSEASEIFSKIIQNNGGREAAKQWLKTHVENNPILARANTPNPTATPA